MLAQRRADFGDPELAVGDVDVAPGDVGEFADAEAGRAENDEAEQNPAIRKHTVHGGLLDDAFCRDGGYRRVIARR